jgi:hypothetical protein
MYLHSGNGQQFPARGYYVPLTRSRFGPEAIIDPSEDFTRVALDAIAYCSMSYRLNSFYAEQQPEFTIAMGDFLAESGNRAVRPRVLQAVMRGTSAKYEADIKKMKDLADQSTHLTLFTYIVGLIVQLYQSSRRAKHTPFPNMTSLT